MEKGPKSTFGEKVDLALEKPAARYAAVLLASGLLHGAELFHRELGEAAGERVEDVSDLMRAVRKEIRLRSEEHNPVTQETLDSIKEGIRPDIDLSDTYLATEGILAGISDSEIAEAKEHYEAVVAKAREMRKSGAEPEEVMGYVLKQQGKYSRDDALLADLLLRGKGNCEARMKFVTAVAEDVYPEWVENHELMVQTFGSYLNEQGEEQDGHVRAVLEQGSDIVVLEGDAMTFEERAAETAPMYDAEWLAVASFLAGQGAFSYDDIGLEDTGTVKSTSTKSLLRFPSSSAHYVGGTGTGDVSPYPVNGSWAESGHSEVHGVTVIDPISDQEFEKHLAERKVYEEGELAEREAFYKEMGERNIELWGGMGYNPTWIALPGAVGEMPITYEEIKKFVAYRLEDENIVSGYVIRPDQKLPPGAEHLVKDAELRIWGGPPAIETLSQLVRFPNIGVHATLDTPSLLAENHARNWDSVRLLLSPEGSMVESALLSEIPTASLILARGAQKGDRGVRHNDVDFRSIEECKINAASLTDVKVTSLHMHACLPDGDITLDSLEHLNIDYLGPRTVIPRIRTRHSDLKIGSASLDVEAGILPKYWLNPGQEADTFYLRLNVAEIEESALEGLWIPFLVLGTGTSGPLDIIKDDVKTEDTFRMPQIIVGSRIMPGAQIGTLTIDFAAMNWEIAPNAFEGAKINAVKFYYNKKDQQRVEAIIFPEGADVEYLPYSK